MNHYTDGTTKKIEQFAGKTIKSFFFPDDDEPFDVVEIVFTDGSHLEFCTEQPMATLAISSNCTCQKEKE